MIVVSEETDWQGNKVIVWWDDDEQCQYLTVYYPDGTESYTRRYY